MKIFSLPLNPKLNQQQFNDFINFCKTNSDYIYDIYVTIRIDPFEQDAMGELFISHTDDLIENALIVQNYTGIPVSATFNNIHISPNQENLDNFIESFEPLYEAGIHSCTLPFTTWLLTGQIQNKFPDLFIKNTILKNINTASDVAKQAESGFDYINIDRDLMRNVDELKKISKVKEKYGIKIALLANESCLGACPIMDEHHLFNSKRSNGPAYFNDTISRVSCSSWDITEPVTPLKTANIPPWRDDWIELLEYVDIFKMHGRESIGQLSDSMSIIENYISKKDILFDDFNGYINETDLKGSPINAWRKFIKNCKFDCWDCNKCDKLYESKNGIRTPDKRDIIIETLCTTYLD